MTEYITAWLAGVWTVVWLAAVLIAIVMGIRMLGKLWFTIAPKSLAVRSVGLSLTEDEFFAGFMVLVVLFVLFAVVPLVGGYWG